MFRTSPWLAGLQWLAFNGLFHLIRALGTPTTVARYEDLVREPRVVLDDILLSEGGSPGPDELGFIEGRTVRLGTDHTVAGNPMRFEKGSFELKLDDAWRASMGRGDRRVTTLLTWPLLVAYGYLRGEGR